jgi:phage protein U
MLMVFGQFVFQTDTLSFNELQRQRAWNHASNPVAKGRAKRQYVGIGDETISLSGLIYQEHGMGNRQSLDDLAIMADQGSGFTLMDGSGYLYGVYIIENLDETRSVLLFNGVPRKIDFSLKLTRVDDDRIQANPRVSS